MKKLPSFLKKYFWDTDFDKIDSEKNGPAIIGKLLELGDEKATQWLEENFSRETIADVLIRFRFVSPKSANYWALIYNVPREKILCLQKHYLTTQRRHWPY